MSPCSYTVVQIIIATTLSFFPSLFYSDFLAYSQRAVLYHLKVRKKEKRKQGNNETTKAKTIKIERKKERKKERKDETKKEAKV